jgi:hypothetical protein
MDVIDRIYEVDSAWPELAKDPVANAAAAGPVGAGRLARITVAAMTEASTVNPAATAMARL